MRTTTELADDLAMALERSGAHGRHLPSCYGGTSDAEECWCGARELERSLAAYLEHRSERPHGWRGYFSRHLAEALAAVSKLVGQ
jgi:hypothetical protein